MVAILPALGVYSNKLDPRVTRAHVTLGVAIEQAGRILWEKIIYAYK